MVEGRLATVGGLSADTEELVARLASAQRGLEIFDHRIVDFIGDLSRRLRRHRSVEASPALGALAFWIRPATVKRLAADWSQLRQLQSSAVHVPRGVVFHMPPTNVDTLFVYSWLLSALMGNANIIRLSPSALEGAAALIDVVGETLDDHPSIAQTTALVSYGHERRITEALSRSDVRVIWGGDDSIQAIRAIPSAPHTRDLAFPDRYSLCLIDADALLTLEDREVRTLAHRFFNDAYWFDQLGCASPRLIVWRGSSEAADRASERFRTHLRDELTSQHHPVTPTSAAIAKLVHATDTAAAGSVRRIEWSDNSLTAVSLSNLEQLRRDSPGGGLFYEVTVTELAEIIEFVTRKDQTVTSFGFSADDIRTFIAAVGSRGIDRVVPVGDALTFGRYWDGVDLLTEFTRLVHITTSEARE